MKPILLSIALVAAVAPVAAAADAPPQYVKLCVPCHGKTGVPPEAYAKLGVRKLSDAEWQKSKTDAQIQEVIEKGSKGTLMRAFKELKPAEVEALVKFVRTLDDAPAK